MRVTAPLVYCAGLMSGCKDGVKDLTPLLRKKILIVHLKLSPTPINSCLGDSPGGFHQSKCMPRMGLDRWGSETTPLNKVIRPFGGITACNRPANLTLCFAGNIFRKEVYFCPVCLVRTFREYWVATEANQGRLSTQGIFLMFNIWKF